ncbi:cation-translocating P-type ATPase [Rhizobium sp. L1K21]|uniref:cation-translocating P-type ATPase n=1 Tax=Rhizobium sp. L1K21 TaxID=2954933 RepID=UPI002093CBF2|nr:cation-translocating P-type ATPase [Rhizobium sp. L1K21]MCO6186183.1 cation-translocating P-type ATPase [Rhizobium sp. L1K21]
MSCCAAGAEGAMEAEKALHELPPSDELWMASRQLDNGRRQTELAVPGVYCGACISTIEKALKAEPEVERARVNLSTKRVTFVWKEEIDGKRTDPTKLVGAIAAVGYESHLFSAAVEEADSERNLLLRSMAVAGFAAMNIMLLSVSVWSGADAATRDLFHWISAAIAGPTIIYAGQHFYKSAFNALRHGRMNMDVPIVIAVTLSYGMSLWETMHHGAEAYFDAAVSLLFFLLIGRTLDHLMRDRARSAITGLARLVPRGATVLSEDGMREFRPVDEIVPGERIVIAAGERIPVDCVVREGASDVDMSIVNGESMPVTVAVGTSLRSGTLNLTGSLVAEATAAMRDSFVAEIIQLMEAAEGGKARYRRIADRAADIYAPAVHTLAFAALIVWGLYSGDWKHALTIAIAVLIITCPCALGLAVPVVQVVAAGRLFKDGIMVKDGSAMERLAEADTVVFDKTGTLTAGRPRLTNAAEVAPDILAQAAELASHSNHPLSKALAAYRSGGAAMRDVREVAGAGLEGKTDRGIWRLGTGEFASGVASTGEGSQTVLSLDGEPLATFQFEDSLRPGAQATIANLRNNGFSLSILSGDRESAVAAIARRLGIESWQSGVRPGGKVDAVKALSAQGRKVLMTGDGINDAPALAAAHVSMAPATAADVGRQAADFVFMHEGLDAVATAIAVSRKAGRLIRENFGFAVVYNAIAIPLALAGLVSPLVAAIAMSSSSIVVVLNALRLRGGGQKSREDAKDDSVSSSAVLAS